MDSALFLTLLPLAFFAVALLYSSVGHAGATGYLALMALAGLAPEAMRPTALALNLAVASIAVVRFAWAVSRRAHAATPRLSKRLSLRGVTLRRSLVASSGCWPEQRGLVVASSSRRS